MIDGLDDPRDDAAISAKANALVLFNPVFDNGPEGGWGAERVGERFREFSPAHNISGDDPPAIVFLGTADKLIPVSTVERFAAGMKGAGVQCETRFYEGAEHGFFNRDPFRTRTLIETDTFFNSLGWIAGPPTIEEP
jgi:acetyl esterase/lipase